MSEFNLYDGDNDFVSREESTQRSSDSGFFGDSFGSGARSYAMPDYSAAISQSVYFAVLAGCLFWGFFVNFIMCKFFADTFMNMDYRVLVFGYLISAIAGTVMCRKCASTALKFVGYNLIVLPLGMVLSIVLQSYSSTVVTTACAATAIITAFMAVLGYIYPHVFEKITTSLCVALIAVILAELVLGLVFRTTIGAIDWVVALIFSGFIAVDFGRASQNEYTVSNAVMAACELYLDIINLLIRLLRIMGRSRN